MSETINLYLGFDPGGKRNFGWSVCREVGGQLEQPARTGRVNNAWDALDRVKVAIADLGHQGNARVLAAGIDAPLFWAAAGGRAIDSSVSLGVDPIHINGLRGAVVVQGPLLAKHLRGVWSDLVITESYPRGLWHLLAQGRHPEEYQMAQRITAGLNANTRRKHERDATLCAVSAWAAIHKPPNWQNLYQKEPDSLAPFDIPVSYWMPVPHPAGPA